MANPDLTPENIVALYQKHNMRSQTCIMGTHLNEEGVFEKDRDKCCALGVYTLGKTYASPDMGFVDSMEIAARLAGVDMWAFVSGFDDPLDYTRPSNRKDHPDYALGRACRAAVEEAKLLDPM